MGTRRLHGFLGASVALVLAVSAATLLGRSWAACDVGVNNAANSAFLVWLFIPGAWTVLLLLWAAAGTLLGDRRRPLLHALALAVTLLGVVWCAISIFWEGSAAPSCPGGVPPWWPSFLPAPGF
ncbi:hypothetical protein [Streptomyces sp. NPDC057910]|uniref:hypothetical protein n=1 Tax=Streptomyces sp. NPDC057910 TaxID=3346278 RepID=UPI0036E6FA96